jgi:hypothetical protein
MDTVRPPGGSSTPGPDLAEAPVDRLGGLTGTYADGVFFREQPAPRRTHVRQMMVSVEISPTDATVREVKKQLAAKVSAAGGNALVSFTYAQTAAMMSWGHGVWRGSGYVARL